MSKILEIIIEKPINCPYITSINAAGFDGGIEVRYTCCRNNIVCKPDKFPMLCPLRTLEGSDAACLNSKNKDVVLV